MLEHVEFQIQMQVYSKFNMQFRASNNFQAGASQIVRSNLFLLRQTLITSYRYESAPSSLHMMFKYETSKFQSIYCT